MAFMSLGLVQMCACNQLQLQPAGCQLIVLSRDLYLQYIRFCSHDNKEEAANALE